MTDQQIALVKSSWNIFRKIDPILVGDVFYSKLFQTNPKLRHLFNISMDKQSEKIMEMLTVMVGRIDQLDELTDDIKRLAIRHIKYGVKEDHYEAVGDALVWMLQQGLGKDWNKEVKDAWSACYQLLSQTMIDAADYRLRE